LLAFSLVKLGKWKNATECIKNVEMLVEKFKVEDQELLEGTKELKQAIAEQDVKMEGEEEGFETYSEEDVSDEENR